MAGRHRGIRTVHNADGSKSYEVRYRDGGRHRSRTFRKLADAQRFYIEKRREIQLGELYDERGATPLVDFVLGPWLEDYAIKNLEPGTLEGYVELLDRHVLPKIGQLAMRAVTPRVVDGLGTSLRNDEVGKPTIRRALYILQGIFRQAEIWGYVQRNPVKPVRKPHQKRISDIVVHPPVRIEAMRNLLLSRGRRADATLVCTLAYAGLRPGEALALRWSHVRARTLLVAGAASLGAEKTTKTHLTRTVDLLDPLAEDLAELRRSARFSSFDDLVFGSSVGGLWSDTMYRNWRKRIFKPIAQATGASATRPYDLRHSFVSLLIYAGTALPEVARQAGHSPEVCASTYVHVFAEFDPRKPVDAVEAVREARASACLADVA